MSCSFELRLWNQLTSWTQNFSMKITAPKQFREINLTFLILQAYVDSDMLKSVMLTMLCLIFNWEVVPRSFWLKDFFLKDIMNAPLNKKKSKNKGKCHSTCTSTWNFWSASTLSRRCWLKFLTWLLMNLMLGGGWFLRVTISNWDRGKHLRFLITLISRKYLMKFVTAYEAYSQQS